MEEHGGNPLPEHVLESIQRNGTVAIKGPITTPVGTGFRSVNVALRKTLDLYGQVRPCKTYPGVRSRYEDVDLIVIRENTEDLYAGIEFEEGSAEARELAAWLGEHGGDDPTRTAGISIKPISVTGTRRIVEFAFDYARRNGRRKVTAVHKANIMKFTDGLYLRVAREVAAENLDIEFDDRIVDNISMQLVQRPEEYDVLVCPNLYGDIVSDLAAGLVGGLGLAPGGNFGTHAAVFEPTHGSAPKYTGQNKREPDGDDALRRDDAAPPRGTRSPPTGWRARSRRDRRGPERHVRHEAVPRRPDRRRDERRGGRNHRRDGGASLRRKVARRRRGQRRRDRGAGDRAPRLRRRRTRGHQGRPPAGEGTRPEPGRAGARLRAEPDRLERLRRDRGLERRRDHGRPSAKARHEPRRPRDDERGDRRDAAPSRRPSAHRTRSS